MVQNSRNKIGLTFNKLVIKVKGDFDQAQQNQFTFNRFSLKAGAIIEDGDRKRAPFLVLGLAP